MLIRKTVLIAGLLALSGATMAHATELGARSILFDNYANERALKEQAQNHAANQWFRMQRQASANWDVAGKGVIFPSVRHG